MGDSVSAGQSAGWLALILGIAAEGAALWLFDQLPRWAQVAVLAPPIALFFLGIGLLVRDRLKRRRQELGGRR